MSNPEVDQQIQNLLDGGSTCRSAAATRLGELKDLAAVPALIEAVKDDDTAVRRTALDALGKIADPSAADAVRKCIDDVDEAVRNAAADALSRIGSAVIPELEKLLHWRTIGNDIRMHRGLMADPATRKKIIAALDRMFGGEGSRHLLRVLEICSPHQQLDILRDCVQYPGLTSVYWNDPKSQIIISQLKFYDEDLYNELLASRL